MEKAFMIQNARENVETVKSYLTDLTNWESEMKRKEAALNGEIEQELPPVRSKAKKEKPLPKVPKKEIDKNRIQSLDYKAWDEFDVDKACAMVDREDRGTPSLDSKTSEQEKLGKLLEESQYEKEKGNQFVKAGNWDEAISCYNRAIELYKAEAIYYANRGLCYLKKDNLHSAEADCTTAISLDPTYVKAYQRRASAREKLGSLRRASEDLAKVTVLEPKNLEAKRLLEVLKKKMGTKGSKSKCSPVSTPSADTAKSLSMPSDSPGLVTKSSCNLTEVEALSIEELHADELRVITPIDKPPHLRSKTPLKLVNITEIPIGGTAEKSKTINSDILIETSTRILDTKATGDSNVNNIDKNKNKSNIKVSNQGKGDSSKPEAVSRVKINSELIINDNERKKIFNNNVDTVTNNFVIVESKKLHNDLLLEHEKVEEDYKFGLKAPNSTVQFNTEWAGLKAFEGGRSYYLSIIDPKNIPAIFQNSLDSNVLSEIIAVLQKEKEAIKSKNRPISSYLIALTCVRRFGALAMFMADQDKKAVADLLEYCKLTEDCPENIINDLKTKFEL